MSFCVFSYQSTKGDGNLDVEVSAFLEALAKPYEPLRSSARIDTELGRQWQLEHLYEPRVP